jgi:hypothetical protein
LRNTSILVHKYQSIEQQLYHTISSTSPLHSQSNKVKQNSND